MNIFRLIQAGCRVCSIFVGLIRKSRYTYTDVLEYQYMQLKNTINFAWNNIPFYHHYWKKNGFDPSKFKTLQDISLIPIIDKNIVREHYKEFIPRNINLNRLILVTTGGTTGMPLQFYIDQYKTRSKEMAYLLYVDYFIIGYKRGIDRIVILRGNRVKENLIQKSIYWQKSRIEHAMIFSSFHLTEQTYQLYIDRVRKYKPRFIRAYPSSIVALCMLMKDHNEQKIEGLRGVICSSENVLDWQRKLIRDVLGVEIYSFYGHGERSVLAWQDKDSSQLLFNPFYGFTEFLDDEMQPNDKKGSLMQVVSTGFDNNYFPFIRYKTADYVETSSVRNTAYYKVANRIIGREQDFVFDKEKNRILFTWQDEAFWGVKNIIAYQYIQNDYGKLQLNLQKNESFDERNIEIIQNKTKRIFINFDIKISIVNDIEKTKAGKFRYLIQNIKA